MDVSGGNVKTQHDRILSQYFMHDTILVQFVIL